MTKLYLILAVAGWAWLVLVALFLVVRLGMRGKSPPRGFEVVETRAQPSAGTISGGGGKSA